MERPRVHGKNCTLEITAVRIEGTATFLSTIVGGNGFKGPSDFAFKVQGNLVQLMKITG